MKKSMSCFKGCVTDSTLVDQAMEGVTSVFHIAGKISYGTFPDFEGMNKINIEGSMSSFNYLGTQFTLLNIMTEPKGFLML